MKRVMIRAWEIVKEAVEKFGGKCMEYMSKALKIAWKEEKEMKLVELKGSEKQIAWAEDIRDHYISVFKKFEELVKEVKEIGKRNMSWEKKCSLSSYITLLVGDNYFSDIKMAVKEEFKMPREERRNLSKDLKLKRKSDMEMARAKRVKERAIEILKEEEASYWINKVA